MPRLGVGLGLGLRQAVFDPDASAFFARVTAAGGTLTATEQTATNSLVVQMKAAGIWTSMKAIYPMVGASAAACAQNLKSSSFTGTFTSGWTFASTGATPNGTSAYMNTGLNPISNTIFNSIHLSYYSRSNTPTGNSAELGSVDNLTTFLPLINLSIKRTEASIPNRFVSLAYSFVSPDNLIIENLDSKGYYLLTRTASNSFKHFKNSIQQGSTVTSNSQSIAPNNTFFIGAANGGGGGTVFSDRECALASIGDGLTDAQASNFYTAVQVFNQTLNRQVGAQIVSDADAQAYINRVYTAGGTLTNTEANAVNQLTIDMKAAGIWTSMKAVYPMVGASAAACAQNLKSSSFTGAFSSGWTFASTGVTPNGTSAFMDTNLNPSTSLSLNSVHFSNYFPNFAAETKAQIGALDASQNSLYSYYNYTGLGALIRTNSNSNVFNGVNQGAQSGLKIVTRTASNLSKVYVNNTNTFSSAATSVALPTINMYIAARNLFGTANDNSSLRQSFCSIGDGLTDTQASDLYTAVQAFQTTLSRQV